MDFGDLTPRQIIWGIIGFIAGLLLAPVLVAVLQTIPGFPTFLSFIAWIIGPLLGAFIGVKYGEERD